MSGGEAGTSDGSGTAAPENTNWKLAALRRGAVTADDWQQEPHLVLSSESQRVA